MREILFRGKRPITENWVYGTGLLYDSINTWLVDNPSHKAIAFGEEHYQVIPETVGQYTGLTDKNGKKIFEGDIVKRDFTLWHGEKRKTSKTQIGVVSYSDTDCGFNLKNACNLRKPWDGDTLEIIGNIHDNPELLKGGG